MKLLKIFSTLTLSLFIGLQVYGAKNAAREAEAAYKNLQFYVAKEKFKEAAANEKKADKKMYYYFMVGECYRELLDHDQAEQYYKRCTDGNYKDPIVYLRIADAQKIQGKYKEAEGNYEKYHQKTGDAVGKQGAESCRYAQDLMKNKTRHIVENEAVLNTEYYDYAPVFADRKNSKMYFSSNRPGGIGTRVDNGMGGPSQDLWLSERDKKGKWMEPSVLPEPINTPANEGAACFDRKGETMYYTNCPDEKKKDLGCDIYFVENRGGKWATPEKMKLKNSDTITVGHPTLTNDDQTLIFVSDMDGGQGGKDLWMVTYNKREKSWGEPVNLGPKINTPGDEYSPFIHDDGSLYFASDGHPGMGGLDLFRAAQVGTEKKWENPTNLGYPMNSAQDDWAIIFEGKEKGLFTSNRVGGKGRDDIYSFMLPPLLFELKITVLEEKSKNPVADNEVILVGTDNSNITLKTNAQGVVSFVLTPDQKRYINENTSYTVEAVKPKGFLKGMELKKSFSTVGVEKSTNWEFTFYLRKVEKIFRLPMIVYEYDKATLMKNDSVNSEDSLLFLYNVLVDNPNINITLRSHTDFRGNDAYNLKLSQRRAQTCVDFLISKGIPANRMRAQGMGEKDPATLADGKVLSEAFIKAIKTKQVQEMYHQLNRRTDFKVDNFDHVPTEEELKLQPVNLPWMKRDAE